MPVTRNNIGADKAPEIKTVKVIVREEGHRQISTGVHYVGDGEEYYAEGEEFEIDETIALELKKRYYVDILKVK